PIRVSPVLPFGRSSDVCHRYGTGEMVMSELDRIIEKLKLEVKEKDERLKTIKKENVRLLAEVAEIRKYATELRETAYSAVLAEAEARNSAIDSIADKLRNILAMSAEQQHAVKEMLAGHKVAKIGSNPSS